MTSGSDRRLLRVAKSTRDTLGLFAEGVSLEQDLGRSITELQHQVTADRLRLAEQFVTTAQRLKRLRNYDPRVVIARLYYAMYHAMRAVVFYSHGGDDHESHSSLYRKVPDDFPNAPDVTNSLKDARLRRNEADYDPYPVADAHFRAIADGLVPIANSLVQQCRIYLDQRGCKYL